MAKKSTGRKVKARDKNNRPICGAKNRSGGQCRNKPMANGRCRYHGGKATGAPVGNQNARKHGLYSEYYSPEETEQLDSIELGKVDDELKLCRVKLNRWLKFQNEVEQAIEAGDEEAGMRLDEKETEEIDLITGEGEEKPKIPAQKIKLKRKRINIEDNIDRLLRRIESLERSRHMLLQSDDGHDYEAELRALLSDED